MIIIRPVTGRDAEIFVEIAFSAGIGITSLPKNREALLERVQASIKSFGTDISKPGNENYLFVLQDLTTGEIGGTCGIIAKTGLSSPLCFYRIEKQEYHLGVGGRVKQAPTLRVVHYQNHWSEIGSLYLCSNFRQSGLGRLLSLSRFLFIAAHRQRFEAMIFAEMRGYIDENHKCPFWEGIGRHFVDVDFEALMRLRDESSFDLAQALPLHPIYIELLPKEVQSSIGKTHPETRAALNMLAQEGFQLSHEIDVCDGGPKIEAEIKELRSIKQNKVDRIAEITSDDLGPTSYILSNHRIDFRCCLAALRCKEHGGIIISAQVADALQLRIGDVACYITASGDKGT